MTEFDGDGITRAMVDKSRDDWNMACLAAGIPAITTDTSARLMAVLYVHGNNEQMVFHKGFLADARYIQQRFRLYGTGVPDAEFVSLVQGYIKELETFDATPQEDDNVAVFNRHIPEWARDLFNNRYGIKLIN